MFLLLALVAVGGISWWVWHYRSGAQPGSDQTARTSHSTTHQLAKTQVICPAGFILVPGNPLYQTGDFCVMKYEAKCAPVTDATMGIQPSPSSACFGTSGKNPEGVYKNSGARCACSALNQKQVVSTASGTPIAFIPGYDTTANNATSYCQNIGAHLITNNEWMTIARNVEQVASNWCDLNGTNCGAVPGAPGKILASGHNDDRNEPKASGDGSGALIAGNDSQPCYGTTTDGTNACGGRSSQKRTLALSTSQVIWDLAGNVWEWTATTTARKDEPKSSSHRVLDLGWTRSDFAPGSLASVITDNGSGPTLGYDAFRPSNPSWNTHQGVGRIYHYSSLNDTDATVYDFLRGGNWRHGDDDGAFTIHLSPPLNRANIDDVGFRCVTSVRQ